jgi:TRAP transporter TAXI family solute receptor
LSLEYNQRVFFDADQTKITTTTLGVALRPVLIIAALTLALVAGSVGAWYWLTSPRVVTLTAGKEGSETNRLALALSKASSDARSLIRFKVLMSSGAEESGKLLEGRKADLAIVRSDLELPPSGQALVINTKRALVLLVPQKRGNITALSDLKGKRIGVVRWTDPNVPLVRKVLEVAEIKEGDAIVTQIEGLEAADLMSANKIDAIAIVAQLTAPILTEIVLKLNRKVPGGVKLLGIDESQAIANRIPGVETFDIPAGALGTGRPEEEAETIAVSYITMARADMSEDLAGRIAKAIMDLRSRVGRQLPQAFAAEAPDGDSESRIPVHPGATAHFEGESKTLFERYSEPILTGFGVLSILGSALTGFFAWMQGNQRTAARQILEEMAELTSKARDARSAEELNAIDRKGDVLAAKISQEAGKSEKAAATLQGAGLAMDQLRYVLAGARQRALG